jgi:SCF-associated factor 1
MAYLLTFFLFSFSEKGNGRLGSANIPKSVVYGVPYPIQVPLPSVRVVTLVAGGMQVLYPQS